MNDLPMEPKCTVNQDIFDSIDDFLKKEMIPIPMKYDYKAYQLVRLFEIDELIRNTISNRIHKNKRHVVDGNWSEIIEAAFGATNDDEEKKARAEKEAILNELAEASFC